MTSRTLGRRRRQNANQGNGTGQRLHGEREEGRPVDDSIAEVCKDGNDEGDLWDVSVDPCGQAGEEDGLRCLKRPGSLVGSCSGPGRHSRRAKGANAHESAALGFLVHVYAPHPQGNSKTSVGRQRPHTWRRLRCRLAAPAEATLCP